MSYGSEAKMAYLSGLQNTANAQFGQPSVRVLEVHSHSACETFRVSRPTEHGIVSKFCN